VTAPTQQRIENHDCKVAIVDDDPRIRSILSLTLEELEIKANFFENAFDLISEIRDHPYSLVMVDLMMPQMDGIECCRRIRKLGYKGKLLVVSALIDAEIKQSALDAGVDRYISKSEIFDQLEIILGELCILS
jgi:DNA-binding response OmpR family regulator